MPPTPQNPDPANNAPDTGQKPLDIQSILLPKKETGPNPESAQRINAGALLAQEQAAASEGLPKEAAPAPVSAAPPAPLTPAAPIKKEAKNEVLPLQTYRSDIEQVVHEGQGVSVVSIAAAEATRRGKESLQQKTPEEKAATQRSWAMLGGGVVLVLIAAGVLAAVFLRPTTTPVAEQPRASFIFVDDMVLVPAVSLARGTLMESLQAARQSVRLPVGLVEWLYVAAPPAQEGAVPLQLGASEFLRTLSPQAPQELLRILSENYLVGVHSFEENQPFLLLQIDSYEVAYRAMLDWERTLSTDLLPLFSRNPSPKLPDTALPASTTPQFLQTNFVDKVVENRDTRAYLNETGDILLLWTFLGRNTILITTNEYTLREVLSRLNTAPVVPIPGK